MRSSLVVAALARLYFGLGPDPKTRERLNVVASGSPASLHSSGDKGEKVPVFSVTSSTIGEFFDRSRAKIRFTSVSETFMSGCNLFTAATASVIAEECFSPRLLAWLYAFRTIIFRMIIHRGCFPFVLGLPRGPFCWFMLMCSPHASTYSSGACAGKSNPAISLNIT
jgi:hypothetical protein